MSGSAALSGSASVGAAFPGWLQLKVIKTKKVAKVRFVAVDIVALLGGDRNYAEDIVKPVYRILAVN